MALLASTYRVHLDPSALVAGDCVPIALLLGVTPEALVDAFWYELHAVKELPLPPCKPRSEYAISTMDVGKLGRDPWFLVRIVVRSLVSG